MDGYLIFSIEVRVVCQATEGSLSQGFSTVAVLALSPDIPLSAIAHELVHSIQSSGRCRVHLYCQIPDLFFYPYPYLNCLF
jgi:hypothetical protein